MNENATETVNKAEQVKQYTEQAAANLMEEYIRGLKAGVRCVMDAILDFATADGTLPDGTKPASMISEAARKVVENIENAMAGRLKVLQDAAQESAADMLSEIEGGK